MGDLRRAQQIRPRRIPFAGELRATELNSGGEIWGETTNLGRGGCYVRAPQSFPQGTLLLIEIRSHGLRFQTDAKVAYTLEPDGMGLSFVNVPASQLPILEDWLSSTAENDGNPNAERLSNKVKPEFP